MYIDDFTINIYLYLKSNVLFCVCVLICNACVQIPTETKSYQIPSELELQSHMQL